jgi:uncharacterized pyridoxamine 5'-phosphate oxidase family protein
MNEKTLNKLDTIINRYKTEPWLYDKNVYVCYEACKSEIRRLERNGEIEFNEYDSYVNYVSDKLGI